VHARAPALERGSADFDVRADGQPFRVTTPTGHITVTGTQFQVVVTQGPPSSAIVRLRTGAIALQKGEHHLEMVAGESAWLPVEGAPRKLAAAALTVSPSAGDEPVELPSSPADCSKHDAGDCAEMASVVEALRALEDRLSPEEERALAAASAEAAAKVWPAVRRLYEQTHGVAPDPEMNVAELFEEIRAVLPRGDVKARPGEDTPAGRLRVLVDDHDLALRTALRTRVALPRISHTLDRHYQRTKGANR
jgi:hypothetical protein